MASGVRMSAVVRKPAWASQTTLEKILATAALLRSAMALRSSLAISLYMLISSMLAAITTSPAKRANRFVRDRDCSAMAGC